MERALDVLSSSREGEWVTAEEFCRAARVVADVTLDPQSCSVQAMVSDRKGCEGEDIYYVYRETRTTSVMRISLAHSIYIYITTPLS